MKEQFFDHRRKRRRPGLGLCILTGACLAGVTHGYSSSTSSKTQQNLFAQTRRLSEEDDRSCASNLQTTTAPTTTTSSSTKKHIHLPPWIARHESAERALVEKKVEWLEFHMIELGFSPLDIRDVAVTLEQASNGDITLLAGMVEFLQLLVQLEDDKQTPKNHLLVTKEVIMASAIHYAECTTALHTGVYDIVREAIHQDRGGESNSSNLSWLLSDASHNSRRQIMDDPVTEYFETELTKSNSAIVLVENGDFGSTQASSLDDDDEVGRIASGAARVKRAEITARAVLGNGRAWSKDEASRLRGLLLTVMDDWRSLGIRAVACLYRLESILSDVEQGAGQYHRSPEVVRAAKEALRVYSPLAQRLGMQRLKARIEDGAFRVLYRRQYRAASALYRQSGPAMKTMSRYLEGQIADLLLENDQLMSQISNIQITSRVKEPYSAWKKLVKKRFAKEGAPSLAASPGALTLVRNQEQSHLSFIDIKDGVALRVIIEARKYHGETDETTRARERLLCYYVQHLIRTQWPLLETDRVKDYIQFPKENGYQSLHYNSYIASQGQEWPFEVQVRSEEMHRIAEFGVAAHWDYKLGSQYVKTTSPPSSSTTAQLAHPDEQEKELVKVQQLLEGVADGVEKVNTALPVFLPPNEDSYIDALVNAKDQLVQNKVFVFFASSPSAIASDGKILSLPIGATVGQVLEKVEEANLGSANRSEDVKILRNGREARVIDLVANGDVLLINCASTS